MTIEQDLHRIANALEAIGNYLQRLAYPPFMAHSDALDDVIGDRASYPTFSRDALRELGVRTAGVDANQAFISGQWKRRDGHNIQTAPTPGQLGDPHARLDPWVRRDVPATEPAEGQLGIKEDRNGKAINRPSTSEQG